MKRVGSHIPASQQITDDNDDGLTATLGEAVVRLNHKAQNGVKLCLAEQSPSANQHINHWSLSALHH